MNLSWRQKIICSKLNRSDIITTGSDIYYSKPLLRKRFIGCRIGGAKCKETRYSTIAVGLDKILQLTVI